MFVCYGAIRTAKALPRKRSGDPDSPPAQQAAMALNGSVVAAPVSSNVRTNTSPLSWETVIPTRLGGRPAHARQGGTGRRGGGGACSSRRRSGDHG
jgi:hypothetical protein